MANFSKMSKTLKREISPDVAFVSYLARVLKQFLAAVSPKFGAGFDGVRQSAEQFFAWLKDSWESTNGSSLANLKSVDAAETFIVDFFDPLLSAKQIEAQLTDPSTFGTAALLRVPGSSASLQPSLPLSRASFTGPPIPNFLLVYAGGSSEIYDLLIDKGLPLNQVEAAVSFVMGSILLCSFPIWTVYHELHGYATFAKLQDRLQASIDAWAPIRDRLFESLQASAPAPALYVVSYVFNILTTALRKKTDEYLPAFSNRCKLINSQRVRHSTDEENTALKKQGFWKAGRGKSTTVNFGPVPQGVATSDILKYIGKIIYGAAPKEEGPEKFQQRSFWAPQSTWDRLVKACQLISQAGFNVYVTAVDNPYEGRHPPHGTHRSGLEIDLIWTFTSDPNDKVPDLEKSKVFFGDGPFFDVGKQQFFKVEPQAGGRVESVTHSGLAKLATIVAIQAVALAGFERYLYLDFINMKEAHYHLGLAIGPQLNPFAGGREIIPFVEGMQHYNHLHVQAPHPANPRVEYYIPQFLKIMYSLALLRDKDKRFLDTMFQPPDVKTFPTRAQVQKVEAFKTDWTSRSSNNAGEEPLLPSLLPIWIPEEVSKRLGQGEKIESVLGITP